MTDKPVTTNEWFWNEEEDGLFNGPFATKDLAIDAAVHGHAVFEDEETDAISLLNGHAYPNPDYDAEYPQDDDNAPQRITGKPETLTKSQALEWCLKEIDDLRAKLKKEAA